MRVLLYVAMSVVVALPFLLDAYLRSSGNPVLWFLLACALLSVWMSLPDYRSRWLSWSTRGLTALVVLNAIVSAGWGLANGEPSPTLEPNRHVRIRYTPEARPPGVSAEQIITTDHRGYRTNVPIDYRHKPAGTLRIVAIGASTTEQATLDDQRIWTYLLGEAIARATGRRVEVINTALSGVRAEQNYFALVETAALAPDLVTILVGINDWNFAVRSSKWPAFQRFAFRIRAMGAGNSLLFRALKAAKTDLLTWLQPIDGKIEPGLFVDDGSYLARSSNSLERPAKSEFHPSQVDSTYADWIERMIQECKRRNLNCLFADQPTAYSLSISPNLRPRLWMTPPFDDYTLQLDDLIHLAGLYNGWLADVTKRDGVAFCELAKYIPPTTEFLTDDCHFTEEGSRRIAQLMTACALKIIGQSTAQ